ncbi:hypothetical protein GOBAR_AA15273 [Gossypium barbadense]|uniref:RNase H type-1 domain-containing protein n=1 Tax=Gossypium barbadense TaxID=3634 RepID=A0A2P5XPY5_GOSBA|nr:hypothetical protein GOBAR_AA15273 [Gossypium barbadense]
MKWFKVNTDGAARQDEKLASSGGVIWDWNGQWVIVFAGSIGACTALEAENDGLNWARKLGLRKVILELENASDVHLLKNPNSATLNTTSLRSIAGIKNLNWELRLPIFTERATEWLMVWQQ